MAAKCKMTRASKKKFKSCVLFRMRCSPASTPKSAKKAFAAALKRCRPVLCVTTKKKPKTALKKGKKTGKKKKSSTRSSNYSGMSTPSWPKEKVDRRQKPLGRASRQSQDEWLRLPPHIRF